MKINRLLLLLAMVTVITPFDLFGQHKNQTKEQNNKVSMMRHGRDFHSKTVVFKIKPEFKSLFENKDGALNAFGKFKTEINITTIKKRFPTVNSPKKEHNDQGQKLVDLSLVYELKYSGNFTIDQVIKKINQTGLVSYSEPSFINHILYIPNDPYADTVTYPGAKEWVYLYPMQFYKAMDITQGDTNMVIGIVDTGTNYNHEDLTNSIKYNYADPINGADDDNDGYTDNFRGWDMGMNDNDPYATGNEHGTMVSGCAAATMDNNKGITGTGGKCKYLPVKATTDDPNSALIGGYDGLVYAVQHNCKVVNLSWGGVGSPSQYDQDVIDYAAINYDAVVVAAAGNDYQENDYYPASYEHVLSVAATQLYYDTTLKKTVEGKADFATYSYHVDVVAMGRKITSTMNDGTYVTGCCVGSSFASPLVAGAAALVRTKFPSLTALQVAERLRVTADPLNDSIPQNIYFKQEKLGKGRINIYRALTDSVLPSIRMISNQISNKYSKYAFSGDTALLVCKFRNYLQKTTNATATVTVVSGNASVVQGSYSIGVVNTLDSAMNGASPFKLYISPTAQLDEEILLRIGYADPASGYTDYQYFKVFVNPSYINIDTNQVTVTVTSNGRIGFVDDYSSIGIGVMYKGINILSESGLMIGTNATKVSDCIRSNPASTVDHDFSYIQNQKYTKLSEGDEAARAILTDTNSTSPIGITVEQRTYAYGQSPDDKYVIIEYDVTNVSGTTIDSIYVGLFSDWDILNYGYNKANWSSADSMGYVYYTGAGGIYAGTCLLTNNAPACYSIENGNTGGTNLNPNDGFTTAEKFYSLSHGIGRAAAGGSGVGYDVSQVVGAGLRNLLANEKRTVAFAILVGDNLTDLRTSAQRARKQFKYFNTSPTPVIATQDFCKGDTVDVTIAPTNGSKFNFYSNPTSSSPVYTGSSYSLSKLVESDTIYVRGTDSLFESENVMAKIIIHTDLKANFSFAPHTIDLGVVPYGFFISTSQNASKINWNMGDGKKYYDTSEVLHEYTSKGNYNVVLTAKSIYNCIDSISQVVKVIGLSPLNPDAKDGVLLYPNPASDYLNIQFDLASPQQVTIQILNSIGQQVEFINAEKVQNSNYVISFEGKEQGVYYAKINLGEKIITRKFTIE